MNKNFYCQNIAELLGEASGFADTLREKLTDDESLELLEYIEQTHDKIKFWNEEIAIKT